MQSFKAFEDVEKGNVTISTSSTGNYTNDLQRKVAVARELISNCLEASRNPVVLCSFGKDSLVLLHLVLSVAEKRVPVIYWREPYFQSKFSHPQKIAELWDLDIYDYPPTAVDYIQLDEYFDVFNFYSLGKSFYVNLYTGTRNYRKDDFRFLCAKNDLLDRPTIKEYRFKWDCIFHGHKECDPLYIAESVRLPSLKIIPAGLLVYAIKGWSNENIWEYIKINDLPYNKERYDNKDEKRNNDLFPTCHDCLNYKNTGKMVRCPKTGKDVPCIAKTPEQHNALKEFLLS